MRNKLFRLKQAKKYKDKTRSILKRTLISLEDFKNNRDKCYSEFKSYNDLIINYSNMFHKNRKRCGCKMCRNQRKNKFLSKKERRTFSENKFHEKADNEIFEYFGR